jgi:phospholipase/carboxylesterase
MDAVVIPPLKKHRFSVIWLHGLGADGHDFESIIPELELDDNLGIKFIFPNAPIIPVTINGGAKMRAWYDIVGFDLNNRVNIDGINKSLDILDEYVQNEIRLGLTEQEIIIAGFSQGGVIALHSLLRSSYRYAAVVTLSSYLPCLDDIKDLISTKNKSTEVFFAHGQVDPVVPFAYGKQAYEDVKRIGYNSHWFEYQMQHQVSWEEINDLSKFLKRVTAI